MKIIFKGVFTISQHLSILRSIKNWDLDQITIINRNNQFFYKTSSFMEDK